MVNHTFERESTMATIPRTDNTQETVHPANGTDFSLKECREVVGGHIEIAHLADGQIMVLNEEGKLDILPLNLEATKLYLAGRIGYDEILGDVLVCAADELA